MTMTLLTVLKTSYCIRLMLGCNMNITKIRVYLNNIE